MLPFCKTFFQMDHNKSLKPSSNTFCVSGAEMGRPAPRELRFREYADADGW